jgi:hypothetical protein
MRLIKLDVIDGITQNIEGAYKSFKASNGDLIASYDGDDDSIPTYTDEERPVYVATIEYQTRFTSEEWRLLLTPAEMKAFRASTDETIADTYALFKDRNGEVNTNSEVFNAVMLAAVSDGALTQDRADELRKGTRLNGGES